MTSLALTENDVNVLNNVERKKHAQKIRIVKQLYMKGAKSNAELCTLLHMSSPTSIALLNELIADHLIEKRGRGKSAGGRKPDLYRIKGNAFYVLSIHIENFRTRMVIVDSHNNYITPIRTYQEEISKGTNGLAFLFKNATELIAASGINNSKLIGVGISMPGLVSSTEGTNHTYLLPPEGASSLQQLLEDHFQKPVYIQNDVKSATLAERNFGLAHTKKNVLVITMDWGIGMGFILDKKLRTGATGFAGEFGHIPIVDNGLLCHCGKRGCLETVASGTALVRMAEEGIKSGQDSVLKALSGKKITPQEVIDAANQGDQFAINLLSEIGLKLGKGIAILIQLFNPEMIILGGKIAEAKQYITTPIQQSINTYCMTQLREKTTIALSEIGEQAGLMGAVATIMENVFEDHIIKKVQ